MGFAEERVPAWAAAGLRDSFLDLYRSRRLLAGVCQVVSLMGKGATYMPMTGETVRACDWTHVPAQTWLWEHRLGRRAE